MRIEMVLRNRLKGVRTKATVRPKNPFKGTGSIWTMCAFTLASCCLGGLPDCRASIWESENWAATSVLGGRIGYDSNTTLSNQGDGAYFMQALPSVEILRRNSSTDLRFGGSLKSTQYLDSDEPSYNDVRFKAGYAYPLADNTVPSYEASAVWSKTSEPNQYLGRRVEFIRSNLSAEGFHSLTGKLGLRGSVDFDSSRYKNSLNHNTRTQAFLGLGYKRTPRTEISLNIGGGLGRSTPPELGTPVESTESYLTLKVRGDITAKITGSVYAGFGRVDYQGGYDNSYNLPVAGADLTWGIDPRRTLVLAAYSGADYTPDGQSVHTSRVFLSFTNVIVNRWEFVVRGGPSHSIFRREFRQRTDTGWESGVEFSYKPSERFRIFASASRSDQDSDVIFNQYERNVFSLGSTYRF